MPLSCCGQSSLQPGCRLPAGCRVDLVGVRRSGCRASSKFITFSMQLLHGNRMGGSMCPPRGQSQHPSYGFTLNIMAHLVDLPRRCDQHNFPLGRLIHRDRPESLRLFQLCNDTAWALARACAGGRTYGLRAELSRFGRRVKWHKHNYFIRSLWSRALFSADLEIRLRGYLGCSVSRPTLDARPARRRPARRERKFQAVQFHDLCQP
jgi:hypothetical protein